MATVDADHGATGIAESKSPYLTPSSRSRQRTVAGLVGRGAGAVVATGPESTPMCPVDSPGLRCGCRQSPAAVRYRSRQRAARRMVGSEPAHCILGQERVGTARHSVPCRPAHRAARPGSVRLYFSAGARPTVQPVLARPPSRMFLRHRRRAFRDELLSENSGGSSLFHGCGVTNNVNRLSETPPSVRGGIGRVCPLRQRGHRSPKPVPSPQTGGR